MYVEMLLLIIDLIEIQLFAMTHSNPVMFYFQIGNTIILEQLAATVSPSYEHTGFLRFGRVGVHERPEG